MKSVRLHAVGDLLIHDEREKLLRVKVVGIGSALHWLSEAGIGEAQLKRPLVLGHEFPR
ncbi:MAG TPA: hypothetical protein VK249_20435 [Anaerolineales bacterium]|nr:hypothetical protein [Anaerolineales bacterium]